MTYRAWEQKPLDRAAVRELTAAIADSFITSPSEPVSSTLPVPSKTAAST